jgi:hypothetical protein
MTKVEGERICYCAIFQRNLLPPSPRQSKNMENHLENGRSKHHRNFGIKVPMYTVSREMEYSTRQVA